MTIVFGRKWIGNLTKVGVRTSDHVTLGKVTGKVQRSRVCRAALVPPSAHVDSRFVLCRNFSTSDDSWNDGRDKLISIIEEVCSFSLEYLCCGNHLYIVSLTRHLLSCFVHLNFRTTTFEILWHILSPWRPWRGADSLHLHDSSTNERENKLE
jgi:hypothetical protein